MTKFTFYNNAVVGEGHSSPHICSEISYGFFIVLSILCDKKMVLDYSFKTHSGNSYFAFEMNEYTKEIVDSYYCSFKSWVEAYNKDEVEVIRLKEFKE